MNNSLLKLKKEGRGNQTEQSNYSLGVTKKLLEKYKPMKSLTIKVKEEEINRKQAVA